MTTTIADLVPYYKYIVNIKDGSKDDVFIGRPSKYSNPFYHQEFSRAKFKVETRKEAIAKFEEMVMADEELIKDIKENLKGKVLGCYCWPAFCHGLILARIANEDSSID